MKVSLVISTYNRPDALRVCLDSALKQMRLPDEIVIGDDGSKQETIDLVKEFRAKSKVPIVHVWQEDKGFRLAMMRNKSIATATGDYIIEVDGDVFLHPLFVADHAKGARKGCYQKGGRTNLGKRLTEDICQSGKSRRIHFWTKGIESKPENSMHLSWVARLMAPRYKAHRNLALGCNMSFFKEDFLRVNGYDEFYEGWGGEDGDFGWRLNVLGLRKMSLKFAGILYHLWHEDKYMYNEDKNRAYCKECEQRGVAYCANGVDKYINNPEENPITILE